MFRKRKVIAPHFRMPNPVDPVHGDDAYLHPPFKPYCRFILSEDLTASDEKAEATTSDPFQWGPGMYHPPGIKIIVHNLLDADEYNYLYTGDEGDVGFAVWDRDNQWRIIGILQSQPYPWFIGKTTEVIASGETGNVLKYCEAWSEDETPVFSWEASDPPHNFTVLNPHDIELPEDLKVRWTKYPCWDNWIVEPWHFTECPPDEEE